MSGWRPVPDDFHLPEKKSDVPRLAPGMVVVLVGPDVRYVVVGLETSGSDAKLILRTEDGQPWIDSGDKARPSLTPNPDYVRLSALEPVEEPCTGYDSDGVPGGPCANCGISRGEHP